MSAQDNRSRLGRGLASLIGDTAGLQPTAAPVTNATPTVIPANNNINAAREDNRATGHKLVPIDTIKASPLNPRKNFEASELDELASSIKQRGVVQPLIVRPSPADSGYELVAGERRWRAAQQAGVHQVPVIVRELNDQEVLELALIENVQRADLNAIEEAFGYKELIERFSYNQEDLAKIIGKSRSHLTNTLRLLKLPESVQAMLRDGEISAGHGRALIGHPDAEKIAKLIVNQGLSVRQVESLMQEEVAKEKPNDDVMAVLDSDLLAIEKELADHLGLLVNIRKGKGQSGEIRVKYKTLDQFDDLYLRLTQKYTS